MDQLWRRVGDLFENLYRQVDTAANEGLEDSFDAPLSTPFSPPLPHLITLPAPQESVIIHQLVEAGASEEDAMELCRIHCDRASDLAERYQSLYGNTIHDVYRVGRPSSSTHVAKLAVKLEDSYSKILSGWMDGMVESIRALKKNVKETTGSKMPQKERKHFNQDFLPYLEAFFEQNKFPSRADKVYLAKRSSMSFRQIHVWFQNRRSRCKREGVVRTQSPTITHELGHDEQATSQAGGDDTELDEVSDGERTAISSRSSSVTLIGDDDPFQCKTRSYTFPAVYPPKQEDYPFSDATGTFTFAKPVWTRYSFTSKVNKEPIVPDVEEVIQAFDRLNIDDSPSTLGACPGLKDQGGCDVLACITTRPPPAPLPSLIRRVVSCFRPTADRLKRPHPASMESALRAPPRLPKNGFKPFSSRDQGARRKPCPDVPVPSLVPEGDHSLVTCVSQKLTPLSGPLSCYDRGRKQPTNCVTPAHTEPAPLGGGGADRHPINRTALDVLRPLITDSSDQSDSNLFFPFDWPPLPSFDFLQPSIASNDCLLETRSLFSTQN